MALRYLRDKKKSVKLWVDAVCIDQDPTKEVERQNQIPLMGDIYRYAFDVVIWLGKGSDVTDKCLTRMRRLSWILEDVGLCKGDRSVFRNFRIKMYTLVTAGMSTQDFLDLISSDWTTRIWTLQECCLASKLVVMYGHSTIPWDRFESFVTIFPSRLKGIEDQALFRDGWNRWTCLLNAPDLFGFLGSATELANYGFPQLRLACLVFITHLAQGKYCSQSHDKLYALYGLLGDAYGSLPAVDYNRDMENLLADFTRVIINSTGTFWPASIYHWKSSEKLGLPSWAIDLTTQYQPEGVFFAWSDMFAHSSNSQPKASLDSKIDISSRNDFNSPVIALHGIAYGKITSAARKWPKAHQPLSKHIECLVSWLLFALQTDVARDKHRNLLDDLKALAAANYVSKDHTKSDIQMGVFMGGLRRWLEENQPVDINALDSSSIAAWIEQNAMNVGPYGTWIPFVQDQLSESTLFSTNTGNLGITTGSFRRGDTIALLAGAQYPVILRQETNSWCCIGSANVHGLMEGQMWPQDKPANELETFVLT